MFHTALAPGAGADTCVLSLTASHVWQVSKGLSFLMYGWLALGSIWLVNGGSASEDCPALYYSTAFTILLAFVRVAVVHTCLPVDDFGVPEHEPPKVTAASPAQIMALPAVRFSQSCLCDPDHASCAVCLAEYMDEDRLRLLPCGHHFHVQCADKWLRQNKRCPLCMRGIDEAPRPRLPSIVEKAFACQRRCRSSLRGVLSSLPRFPWLQQLLADISVTFACW